MKNTIQTYHNLRNEQPEYLKGYFFAFSDEQFNSGRNKLLANGSLKEDEKLVNGGYGLYGTRAGLDFLFNFYEERNVRIKEQCDMQEVYEYECYNHESEINWDGDEEAVNICRRIWGDDAARTLKRHHACYDFDTIVEREKQR